MNIRKYIYIVGLFALIASFVSCEESISEDDTNVENGGDDTTSPDDDGDVEETVSYMTFTADTDEFTWSKGVSIGVFSSDEEASASASNWWYSYSTDLDDSPLFQYVDRTKALMSDCLPESLVAYYPYSTSVSGGLFRVNVSSQVSLIGTSLRVAELDLSSISVEGSNLPLDFSSPLASIKVNLIAGNNVSQSDFDDASVSISGILSTADFNMSSCEYVFSSGSIIKNSPFSTDGTSSSCETVIIPQEVTSSSVSFTFDLEDKGVYVVSLPDNISKFEAGYQYEFEAVFDNENATITSANITKWVIADTIIDVVYDTAEADAMIYPTQTYAKVIEHIGYDTKDGNTRMATYANAEEIFVNQDFDAIRISLAPVAIFDDESDELTGHPEPGVVVESVYSSFVTAVQNAKAARGDKELIVFASKKVHWTSGAYMWPSWVQPYGTTTILDQQYVTLVVDFIQHFYDNGIVIDVVGFDNEGIANKAITAAIHVKLAQGLRDSLSTREHLKMPLIIGRESWEPNSTHKTWLSTVIATDPTALDLYGVHYYPGKDHPENYVDLIAEVEVVGERPFWATEPHWDSQSEVNSSYDGDMLYHAMEAISCLWAQSDLGMSAFMWWSYSNTATDLRAQLMNTVTVPLRGAQPIRLDDHDGSDDVLDQTVGNLMTRAFVEDDLVTLYALNIVGYEDRATGVDYKSYKFGLGDDKVIDGDVTYSQWCGVEDAASSYTVVNDQRKAMAEGQTSFRIDLPNRSVTRMQFKVKEK